MPGQHRGRGDDPMRPYPVGQQAGEGGQDRPVRPGQPQPAPNLTAQHRNFMPQREDLDQQRSVAANQQPQTAEQAYHPQVQQPHTTISAIISPSQGTRAHSMCDRFWHGTGRLTVIPTRLRGKILSPLVMHGDRAPVTPDIEFGDSEDLQRYGGLGRSFLTPGHTAVPRA